MINIEIKRKIGGTDISLTSTVDNKEDAKKELKVLHELISEISPIFQTCEDLDKTRKDLDKTIEDLLKTQTRSNYGSAVIAALSDEPYDITRSHEFYHKPIWSVVPPPDKPYYILKPSHSEYDISKILGYDYGLTLERRKRDYNIEK